MEQMAAVEEILSSLGLQDKPVLKVFNKLDLVNSNLAELMCRRHQGVAIAATDLSTLPPLIACLEKKVEELEAGRQEVGDTPPDAATCRVQE